jgi:hypothetical protein
MQGLWSMTRKLNHKSGTFVNPQNLISGTKYFLYTSQGRGWSGGKLMTFTGVGKNKETLLPSVPDLSTISEKDYFFFTYIDTVYDSNDPSGSSSKEIVWDHQLKFQNNILYEGDWRTDKNKIKRVNICEAIPI